MNSFRMNNPWTENSADNIYSDSTASKKRTNSQGGRQKLSRYLDRSAAAAKATRPLKGRAAKADEARPTSAQPGPKMNRNQQEKASKGKAQKGQANGPGGAKDALSKTIVA